MLGWRTRLLFQSSACRGMQSEPYRPKKEISHRPVCDNHRWHMQEHSGAELGGIHLWPCKCAQLFQAASPVRSYSGLTHLEEHVVTRRPPFCSQVLCLSSFYIELKKSSNARFSVESSSHHHQNCCVQNADS